MTTTYTLDDLLGFAMKSTVRFAHYLYQRDGDLTQAVFHAIEKAPTRVFRSLGNGGLLIELGQLLGEASHCDLKKHKEALALLIDSYLTDCSFDVVDGVLMYLDEEEDFYD